MGADYDFIAGFTCCRRCRRRKCVTARPLGALIAAEVRAAGGWLSFERYMELALYAPGLGYYSAGSVKLGAQGDFVTAPEVSELFGRCVARQCAEVLADDRRADPRARRGQRAARRDAADRARGGRRAARALRDPRSERGPGRAPARAPRAAAGAPARARGVAHRLPEAGFRGVMLANEVADALPCRRFTLQDGALRELGVTLDAAGALREAAAAAGAAAPGGVGAAGS